MTKASPLPSYRLLASAIAGRPLEVDVAGVDGLAWTDGVTVYVPDGAEWPRQVATLAVQAALVGAGSLDEPVMAMLARRPAVARRYLAVESQRALVSHEHLLPWMTRPLVDRALAERTSSPAESLALARSKEPLPEPPAVFGVIRPTRLKTCRGLGDDERAGRLRHVPRRGGTAELGELVEDDDDLGPVVDVLSSPVGGGAILGRLLKKLLGDARSQLGGPPGADSPTHWSRRAGRAGAATVVSTETAPAARVVLAAPGGGTTYPEWDDRVQRYRPGWCTVQEPERPVSELAPFVPGDRHALRRALGRLGVDLERHHRQLQGDDIDIDAAVEGRVEALAGCAPAEAVYIDSLRRKRDLSVLVLLDVSGSAGEPSATGVPVHEHQRAAAGLLTAALHELGDRVALYAFRSQGRSAVHVIPVKRFGDDLDTVVMHRLGGLVPAAYTRLGAAIRHSTTILETQAGTARRLLVVLSDGFAYDHGYEPAYGEADARKALAEARRAGIGCLCLSLGAGTRAETLRRVFGTAAFAAMPRVDQLPGVLGPLFRAALGSAEVQRRVFLNRVRAMERLDVESRTA